MKKVRYIVIVAMLIIVFCNQVFAAPSFLPGIYKVEADEDSFSASFYFEILDPEPGSYERLSGSVSGVDTSILSDVSVSKFSNDGANISVWRLVFKPVTDKNGTDSITVTITDGSHPVSKDMTITITPLNDAPILHNGGNDTADMSMPDITDTDVTVSTVRAIIDSSSINGGNAITDVDGDPEGIAIIAVNSAVGTWAYSTDNGANWIPIGTVSEDNALLLDVNALVRFTRTPGWSGVIPNGLRIKAWDHSDKKDSGNKTDTTNYQNVQPPRDKHPFSSATELVSIKACPTLNTNYCYSVNDTNNSLISMINGSIGPNFTAGSFATLYGNVVIQPNGNFTYTKGARFTCADSFNFTANPGEGCPPLNGTAFVLQPICADGDLKIDLEDAIRALQVVTGLRPN